MATLKGKAQAATPEEEKKSLIEGGGMALELRLEESLDERGWPKIYLDKLFPCMSNSDIAVRAQFFARLRALSEDDYMAGKGFTVETIVREDPRNPIRRITYRIGGKPRHDRSYAEMEAELVAAVRQAHTDDEAQKKS